MTERKFTDDEIIKALGLCNTSVCTDCEECPYANEKWCVSALTKDALALINRQKAEIEKQDAEIKRLNAILDSYALQYGTVTDQSKKIAEITAEARKEFVERLKNNDFFANFTYKSEARLIIDKLAEELLQNTQQLEKGE